MKLHLIRHKKPEPDIDWKAIAHDAADLARDLVGQVDALIARVHLLEALNDEHAWTAPIIPFTPRTADEVERDQERGRQDAIAMRARTDEQFRLLADGRRAA